MYFKNIIAYKLNGDLPADLEDQLGRGLFVPCGKYEPMSRGWIPVQGSLIYSQGHHKLIALKVESKILPASVINKTAQKLSEEMEAIQGYKPGRKQMKEIKEAAAQDLLAMAFTKERVTYCWIDTQAKRLMIDAGAHSKAEEVIEHLRNCLDEFPLAHIETERSATSLMADWLAAGEAEDSRFTIDRDCELRDVSEEKATVKYTHHPLDGEDTRNHLASGKLPTKLAMTFDDRISFVLTHDGIIKRIAYLDILKEEAEADTQEEQFEADFAIATGEVAKLIDALIENLGEKSD